MHEPDDEQQTMAPPQGDGEVQADQVHASAVATPNPQKSPILIIVMGVSGTGKTTLARALETRLKMSYIEGDALHPAANIAKMSAGIPLTDADREPWLHLIRTTAERVAAEHPAQPGVLATCSSLRAYYRDILRGTRGPETGLGSGELRIPDRLPTYFVYIKGERDAIMTRITARQGHYMKPGMLDSQLQTLESPEGEVGVVVVPLEASTEEQAETAIRELNKLLPEPKPLYA